MLDIKIKKIYPFSFGNRLVDINTYCYTTYYGKSFLTAWKETRKQFILDKEPLSEIENLFSKESVLSLEEFSKEMNIKNSPINTDKLLDTLYYELQRRDVNYQQHEVVTWLNAIVKKFEVSKKIFSSYSSEKLFVIDREHFQEISLYFKFAYIMVFAYEDTKKLQYLNVLLKLLDTLCAMSGTKEKSSDDYNEFLSVLIQKENYFVNQLHMKLNNENI